MHYCLKQEKDSLEWQVYYTNAFGSGWDIGWNIVALYSIYSTTDGFYPVLELLYQQL